MSAFAPQSFQEIQQLFHLCEPTRDLHGFVPLQDLFSAAQKVFEARPDDAGDITAIAKQLCCIFNSSAPAQHEMRRLARQTWHAQSKQAANVLAWMAHHDLALPCPTTLPPSRGLALEADLLHDSAAFLTQTNGLYPLNAAQQHLGFDTSWVLDRLTKSQTRFEQFAKQRRSDTAILVGNGPSLNVTDLDALQGQDVFISNYATRHQSLFEAACGAAVSNILVAEQAPHVFQLGAHWRFFPVWLGHLLGDNDKTIWLNALGGPMFFSEDLAKKVAWHATVSFFWLQILYCAGYRKIILIGVDNSYRQDKTLKEGDLVHQTTPDLNHFDPTYFQGKIWQAADTDHMQASFELAKQIYEKDGREIVNCTVGGALEVFRRADLKQELQGH
ncbi:hypothetical protein J7382_01035 [Shimia sp. R11_0]|uniref:hypothetical protein n=1 Tax=Shimia sp. R11_0 TaxID=2821096 RepID=UPI001ADBC989|nr:hypothetical protein [Shimia sp. R11_0]MBO9476105.1 hypothetical protein [Shimia sp. R11_0]